MQEKDDYLKTAAELSTEQNTNMLDGIINNTPPVPQAREEEKPLDRVKQPPTKRRSREREDR